MSILQPVEEKTYTSYMKPTIFHKINQLSLWKKVPIYFFLGLVVLIIGLFQFPKLQYILYPLPDDDGFSLLGHEAIIKISGDGRGGDLYKYIYCDPKECGGKRGVEKISDTNYAYVEKLNLTKEEVENYPRLQSKNFAREEHVDLIGNLESCYMRNIFMFDFGCTNWYEKRYLDKSNNQLFKFGEILFYDSPYAGQKANLSTLNNDTYLGLDLIIHGTSSGKEYFNSYIYIYIYKLKVFVKLINRQDKILEIIDFK